MFYFLKLAAGNLIKNKRTSITILIVIFVCIFAMEFGVSYMYGFEKKMKNEILGAMGHIRVYNETFYKEIDFSMVEYNVPYSKKLRGKLGSVDGVNSVRAEINYGAIANTPGKNLEVMVKSIERGRIDRDYSKLKNQVIEGRFIEKPDEVVIGYKAAEILKVSVGDRVIIMSVNSYGSISAAEGKVVGLTKSLNITSDERGITCPLEFSQKLLGLEGRVTEIAVNINDPFMAPETAGEINKILPAGAVSIPWQEEQQALVAYLKVFDISVLIMSIIVIAAASLGIINSFLMNVMNRLPEFGVMRAMGVSKFQLVMMILTESIVLGVTGTVAAMIPGTMLVKYFEANPFNYENMWRVMQSGSFSNMDTTQATVMLPSALLVIFMTGVLTSIVASMYPAMIASNKKPSDVLRVME